MSIVKNILTNITSSLEKELLGSFSASQRGAVDDTQSGDVVLESLVLKSEDGQREFDLLDHCKTIDIYESIMSPSIFVELGIADAIGLYESFPIIGEEFVSIKFKTPGSRPAKYLMRVNQILNKKIEQNNKMVTYTIQLMSPEVLRNSTRFVNKAYKEIISNVVDAIISEELGTEKPVFVESTSGIENGNISRLTPFSAIDFLRRRSVSDRYKSSTFVFFEGQKGYHFTTIERLIKDGKSKIGDKEFFFDTVRHQNYSNVTQRNIIAYNQVTFADTVTKAKEGGIANEVGTFDLVTGEFKLTKYEMDDSFEKLDKNGAPVNTSTINNYTKSTSTRKIIPISSDLPANKRQEKIGYTTLFSQAITQNICRIYIYGDSEITVGDVITCHLPVGNSMDDSANARLESGNYLVAKVRHLIVNSDRPQHMCSLELIKGNFLEAA